MLLAFELPVNQLVLAHELAHILSTTHDGLFGTALLTALRFLGAADQACQLQPHIEADIGTLPSWDQTLEHANQYWGG